MKKLTIKEKNFCRHYAVTVNHREAASKAGYGEAPENVAVGLLERREIGDEIEKVKQARHIDSDDVAAGYKRIAFGSIADCVRLLFSDSLPDDGTLESMDLFLISELKRPRDGSMEMKFFSRLEALDKLASFVSSEQAGASSFYQALERSASRLEG